MGNHKREIEETREAKEHKVESRAAREAQDTGDIAKSQQMKQAQEIKERLPEKVPQYDAKGNEKVGAPEKPPSPEAKKAMEDAAKAIATGDIKGLSDAFKGLTPEQAAQAAAGLDKALKSQGIRVNYDADSGAVEVITGPGKTPKLGDPRNEKIMIPRDGGTPQVGRGDTFYSTDTPQVNKDATSKDLEELKKDAKKYQEEAKKKVGAL
ncbi:MAG TPA: hypothetical protein V6D08_01740 [Candidatus Obscuribacterales bacterium]